MRELNEGKKMKNSLKNRKNELIEKRRKKKRIKRNILLIIVLVSTLITLCLKLQYFNITGIIVSGNINVEQDEIKRLSNINIGNNIFYINTKTAKNNIMKNPYVETVNIRRKLPNLIEISVKERTSMFYNISSNNKSFVIDKTALILDEKDSIDGMNLIKLDGFDYKNSKAGKIVVSDDKRKIDTLLVISDLILRTNSDTKPTSVDISDLLNIKIYYGDMCVKLGTSEDLPNKLNAALNILIAKELKASKGYIDVSFNGKPVFFVEK